MHPDADALSTGGRPSSRIGDLVGDRTQSRNRSLGEEAVRRKRTAGRSLHLNANGTLGCPPGFSGPGCGTATFAKLQEK